MAMTKILDEVLAANAKYAENFGDKGNLPLPPSRHLAILTCMDARLDPAKYAGLAEGDAHVIRNAGGRASDDAIRSLVISPINSWAPANGSSSTTRIAGCSCSQTTTCAIC
jgi:carbonic anhydrase